MRREMVPFPADVEAADGWLFARAAADAAVGAADGTDDRGAEPCGRRKTWRRWTAEDDASAAADARRGAEELPRDRGGARPHAQRGRDQHDDARLQGLAALRVE